MNRDDHLKLLSEKLSNKNLIKHSLAVEAVMKSLAKRFGQDEEIWRMAGLLHDLDYEVTANEPAQHGIVTSEWLSQFDIPSEVTDVIKAHNAESLGIDPKTIAERAIYAVDPLTGLIVAAALMTPDKKIAGLKLSSLMKKFKTSGFAKGASRENIRSCSAIGLELEEFINIALIAMQGINSELGL
jgi:putative nucleotidyltransferase with HDIG domain